MAANTLYDDLDSLNIDRPCDGLKQGHTIRGKFVSTEYGLTNGIPVIRYNGEFCVNMFGNECKFTPLPQNISSKELLKIALIFNLCSGFHQESMLYVDLSPGDRDYYSSILPIVHDTIDEYLGLKRVRPCKKKIRVTLTRIS